MGDERALGGALSGHPREPLTSVQTTWSAKAGLARLETTADARSARSGGATATPSKSDERVARRQRTISDAARAYFRKHGATSSRGSILSRSLSTLARSSVRSRAWRSCGWPHGKIAAVQHSQTLIRLLRASSRLVASNPRESGIRVLLVVAAVVVGGVGLLSWLSVIAAVGAAVALDLQHPFSLRNFFFAYVLLLFGVGGQYFAPDDLTLSVDLLLFLAFFAFAYAIARLLLPRHANVIDRTGKSVTLPSVLLICVSLGWAALLAAQIGIYGMKGFYAGEGLADRITKYGRPDFLTGLQSIIEQGLSIVTVASVVMYVQSRVNSGKRPNYFLLSLPLVVAPVLLLRRYDFAVGLLLILAIQPIAARLCGVRYSILASAPLIAGSLGLAFAVSVMVGSLRESALASPPNAVASPTAAPAASPTGSSTEEPVAHVSPDGLEPSSLLKDLQTLMTEQRLLGPVYSEMSPITGYRDIREHPNDFTYKLGTTILPPLVARIVPRSWFPAKPVSSGAYYNETRTPEAFAAGYALPVTVFGDALLNFGYLGALAAAAVLGVIAGRLDRVFDATTSRGLPMFLIVFYGFYSLLRTDLANSVSVIVLTTLTFVVLRRLLDVWLNREPQLNAEIQPTA